MNKQSLTFAIDGAALIAVFAACSYVMGSLYNSGYLSLFGLGAMTASWDTYGTMYRTWAYNLGWIALIVGYIWLKAMILVVWKSPPKLTDGMLRVIGWTELLMLIASFFYIGLAVYHRGETDALNKIQQPTEVVIVTNSNLKIERPLYLVAHSAENYVFFRPLPNGARGFETIMIPQSEIRSLQLQSNANPGK